MDKDKEGTTKVDKWGEATILRYLQALPDQNPIIQGDAPVGGPQQTGNRIHHGCLARPRSPKQHGDTRRCFKGDIEGKARPFVFEADR